MSVQVLGPAGFTTKLAADVTAGATSIPVISFTGFPASGNYTIFVDQEQMTVTAGHGTNAWTVTRGAGGTTAVAHSALSLVTAPASFSSGQVYKNPTSGAAVTASAPPGACGVFISVQTQDARVSFDGTAATSTNGLYFKAGGNEPVFFPTAGDLSIIGLNVSASDVSLLWVK